MEQTNKTNKSGEILLIFFIILLLGIGILFFILWLIKRTPGRKTELPDDINVNVTSDRSLRVRWNGKSDKFSKKDKINVFITNDNNYQIKDGKVFDENGNEVQFRKTNIDPTQSIAVIDGLNPNSFTFVITTLTGDDTNSHNSNRQEVFTETTIPLGQGFIIMPIGYDGLLGFEIEPNNSSNPVPKIYTYGTSSINNKNICGVSTGRYWEYDQNLNILFSKCNNNTYYLMASSNNIMLTQSKSNATKWSYINNHWCISNTGNDSSKNCLIVDNSSSNYPKPVIISTLPTTPELINGNDVNQRWAITIPI